MDVDSVNETLGSCETIDEVGLRVQLIDHIASADNVHFKSQQIGEPELSFAEKRAIVEEVLNRNICTFLSRFGQYVLPEHLPVIENHTDSGSYEVQFYINKLKNNQFAPASKVQIKNRRFEAMKRLMSEGEYFSVGEMRKRNPLLFDQLVGNFLKNPRKIMNETDHPIAHILLDQIEQDQVAALKQSQIEAEMKEAEEYPISDDDIEENLSSFPTHFSIKPKFEKVELWGNEYKNTHVIGKSRWKDKHTSVKNTSKDEDNLTQEEKVLLINEFTSAMFNSFLLGKDEFDYSDVDNNPEYDDVYQCDVDEEEKYFDSESPEVVTEKKIEKIEHDEFDKFMQEIEHEVSTENLVESLRKMDSTDT